MGFIGAMATTEHCFLYFMQYSLIPGFNGAGVLSGSGIGVSISFDLEKSQQWINRQNMQRINVEANRQSKPPQINKLMTYWGTGAADPIPMKSAAATTAALNRMVVTKSRDEELNWWWKGDFFGFI
jgi:hypothetical protein